MEQLERQKEKVIAWIIKYTNPKLNHKLEVGFTTIEDTNTAAEKLKRDGYVIDSVEKVV